MIFVDYFWKWPDGLVWRISRSITEKSRRSRFSLFMRKCSPSSSSRVLDVGVGEGEGRFVNFFEEMYPWKSSVTALALTDLPEFRRAYPGVTLVIGDGCKLSFGDRAFDVVFSNAVIEHVGTKSDQKKFISEACRVADRVFLSTPNRWFPVDAHTLIPFAHWLPMRWRNRIYRWFGRDYFASEKRLRLIGENELLSLVPPSHRAVLFRQRVFGWTSNLNLVLTRLEIVNNTSLMSFPRRRESRINREYSFYSGSPHSRG